MRIEKLPESLKSQFRPDFFSLDPDQLIEYGQDWTRFHSPQPLAIAFPRTTLEVSTLLKICQKEKIAVVPSGGRTGLSGGALAIQGEIIVSLSKMNTLHPVDEIAQTVRVQAGAITEAVHQHGAKYNLTWPIDFASKGSSTVGGNIATNAGGVKVIRYGLTREWVLGLEVVLMDGSVLELNGALIKNNTGYDLRQFFIGSEGTLGIITEATLKLCRMPSALTVFFFALESMEAVLRLFLEAQKAPFTLSAFECMSQACMENVQKLRNLNPPFSQSHPYCVLLEMESEPSNSNTLLDHWLENVFNQKLVLDGTQASNSREASELWAYREGISESISARGIPHKNDIALPVSGISAFLDDFLESFEKQYQGFELFIFGHIGDGNLHINILKPDSLPLDEFKKKTQSVDALLFSLLKKHQGSVSAEHGIGLLKKAALPYSRTEREIALFKGIKKVFDPDDLMNPGKIF